MQTINTGSLVFISSTTISADATVDINSGIDSTCDEYVVQLIDIVPATDNTSLKMRTDTNGGASFDTTSYASTGSHRSSETTTRTEFNVNNGAQIDLTGTGTIGSAADESLNGEIRLYRPSSTTKYLHVRWVLTGERGTTLHEWHGRGLWNGGTGAIDEIQLYFNPGNLSTGTIRSYGISNS